MANFIGNVVTPRVSTRSITKVLVPEGGLHAGQVVTVSDLEPTIRGNYEVFVAQVPTGESIADNKLAMIIDDTVETLQDGRRPDGQPDFSTYSYKEGEVATAVFLDQHLIFRISVDSLDPASNADIRIGSFLMPVAGSNNLAVVEDEPAGLGNYLKVLARYDMPMGGNLGLSYIPAYVCVAYSTNTFDEGNTLFTFTLPNQVSSVINQRTDTVDVVVAGPLTNLAATFSTSPNSVVTVNGVPQVSGQTVNDFSSIVEYNVADASGESREYIVDARLAESTLYIENDATTSVVVTRNGIALNNGASVSFGDVLTISTSYTVGYENATLTVNDNTFTSGNTFTVGTDDVSIVATSQLEPYTLAVQQGENTTITVLKGEEILTNGATLYYGDQISVTVVAADGFTLAAFTINSTDEINSEVPVYYTITGDTTITTTATAN